MTDLEGATEQVLEGQRIDTPGQFAAEWNAADDAQREHLLATLHRHAAAASRCVAEGHDDELLEVRGRLTAVLVLHQPPDGDDPASTYCAHDDNPWPCPTARAAGVQPEPRLHPAQQALARRIRIAVDSQYSRVLESGQINGAHVAAEITLREREGLPHYIAELDGPGKYRP